MQEFIEKLADVLDTEAELTVDTALSELEEWDSLGIVGFVAMANAVYGKKLAVLKVRSARTVADLYALLK